jgi:putative sigma-54 modulation protein
MKIGLQTQGFELTEAIEAHVQKQLNRSLATVEDHVFAVDVFLSDINGPRGGNDKRALICVQLAGRHSVKVERTHADLYSAVSSAARQVRGAAKRSLRKRARLEKAMLRELRQFPADLQTS